MLLVQIVTPLPLRLYALSSEDHGRGVMVDADLVSLGRNDQVVEQAVTRLSLEDSITSIKWHLLPASGQHPDEDEG